MERKTYLCNKCNWEKGTWGSKVIMDVEFSYLVSEFTIVKLNLPLLKNQVWKIKFNELGFQSTSNWGFTASVACKNPVRNGLKIQFVELDFSNLTFKKWRSVCIDVDQFLVHCNFWVQKSQSKNCNPLQIYWRSKIQLFVV